MAATEAELSGLRAENARLDEEIESLRSQLDEVKQNASLSAECGLKLMEMNQELEQRLEQTAIEYTEQIQSLKQEQYTLQTQLNTTNKTARSFQQEYDNMKEQLAGRHKMETDRADQLHTQRVNEMTRSLEQLESELEQAQAQSRSYQEKIKALETTIARMREEALSYQDTTELESEVLDLHTECVRLRGERDELQCSVMERGSEVEMTKMELVRVKEQLDRLEEEATDRITQSNDWYRNLQEVQEENIVLRSRMDHMRDELLDQEWTNQGNSLFGEVEDRRQATERQLISIQVKYEAIEKSHTSLKQQQKKMKAEMCALLSRHGMVSADAAQVQRLQRALQQRDSELKLLNTKMDKMKREPSSVATSDHTQRYAEAFVQFGDKKEYIDFLELQLRQKEESMGKLMKEASLKETQFLCESNKLMEAEAKLHRAEQEKSRMINSLCKLNIRLTEAKDRENEAIGQLRKLESEQKACEDESKASGRRRRSHYPTAQQQPDTGCQQEPGTTRHEVARSKPVAPAVRKPAVNLLAAVDEAYNVTSHPRPHVGGAQTDVGGAQTDVGGAQDEADSDETIQQIEEKQVDSTIVDNESCRQDNTGMEENMDSTNIPSHSSGSPNSTAGGCGNSQTTPTDSPTHTRVQPRMRVVKASDARMEQCKQQ